MCFKDEMANKSQIEEVINEVYRYGAKKGRSSKDYSFIVQVVRFLDQVSKNNNEPEYGSGNDYY